MHQLAEWMKIAKSWSVQCPVEAEERRQQRRAVVEILHTTDVSSWV